MFFIQKFINTRNRIVRENVSYVKCSKFSIVRKALQVKHATIFHIECLFYELLNDKKSALCGKRYNNCRSMCRGIQGNEKRYNDAQQKYVEPTETKAAISGAKLEKII